MRRRTFLTSVVAGFGAASANANSTDATVRCTVDLPNHMLEYAVPKEVARNIFDWQRNARFDPVSGFEHGYQHPVAVLHDIAGSFFTGPAGQMNLDVMVQERSADFEGDIATAEGLENYISWWIADARFLRAMGFGRISLNGMEVVSRGIDSWAETISFPLDQKMFVEFGLDIKRILPGGPHPTLIRRAEAMRMSMRNSLRLRAKT